MKSVKKDNMARRRRVAGICNQLTEGFYLKMVEDVAALCLHGQEESGGVGDALLLEILCRLLNGGKGRVDKLGNIRSLVRFMMEE